MRRVAAFMLALERAWLVWLRLWRGGRAGAFGGVFRVPLSQLPSRVGEVDATYLATGRFYLSRTPAGILVLYRRCTHLGCAVPWQAEEPSADALAEQGRFHCPCHGSVFDRYGMVKAGPAFRPLDLFPARIDGDCLAVDTNRIRQRSRFEDSQAVAA